MSNKIVRPRSQSPGRGRAPAGRVDSLATILCNPVYGYGRWLEPSELVAAHVLSKNVELAAKQKAQGSTLTLDELDAEFTALMDEAGKSSECEKDSKNSARKAESHESNPALASLCLLDEPEYLEADYRQNAGHEVKDKSSQQ